MSIDPNKFGISKSLIDAVNEALKGGQVKIDKNHNGKIDGQDFKMLRKEELKGNQTKIDKNHNGKIDGQDFKMLRKEEEAIDEKRGLWDNIHAKQKRIKAGSGERMRKPGSEGSPSNKDLRVSRTEETNLDEKSVSKAQQHAAGAALATQRGEYDGGKKGGAINRMASMKTSELRKFAGTKTKGLPTHKEEVEQVDELSKQTMGSYIKKASHDVATKSAATGRYADRANAVKDQMKKGDYSNYQQGKKDDATADKMFNKSWKRRAGIAKATDKLTKEEDISKKKVSESLEQVDELSGSLAHRAAHGAWIKTDKAKAAFKGQAKAAAQARKFGQYAVKKGYYDAPKKTNEEVEQVDEISTKLAVNYAKGALKSMDTAAAKGSAGHDTFMKRSAGQKLALDKTNPEHKRLKAKVGTSDANAKDAAYKKTVGEDVEQVNELSKATLGSYVNKSAASLGKAGYNAGSTDGTAAKLDPHIHTINKRSTGIKRAVGKLAKEDTQIDELSTNTYHKAAHKAAKRAMGDAQGRSGPIFKKYAGMANKFRDKGMSQEKKEKAMKEETDPGFAEATMDPATKQLAAKKAAIQKTIVQKKMQVMQSKANKQISSMKEAKCTCAEGKKSMTCEVCNDKSMGIKGGKEKIQLNPPLRD